MTSATAVAERGHLLAPELFDLERRPEIAFTSETLRTHGDDVTLADELEIAGEREPVGARGTLRGPADDVTLTVTLELVRE